MGQTKVYECFPIWIVVLSNFVGVLIYLIGAYVLAGFGLWLSGLYLLYCFGLELRLLKGHCVNCYYYGKSCGGEASLDKTTSDFWFRVFPGFY